MHSVMEQEQLPEAARLLETLRRAIYHGELTPGQRLVEADVASRYDASRAAAAEAAMRQHLLHVIDGLRQLAELGPSPLLPSTAWG